MAGMVIVRLFLGGYFLFVGLQKALAPKAFTAFLASATQAGTPESFVDHNAWPAYAHFLSNTVHPHVGSMAMLLIVVELTLAVLFLVGLLTRGAALAAMGLNTAYLLATLYINPYSLGLNLACLAMALAVLVAAAGRTWGLDALLAARTRVKLLW
jgi:uncharacterized membrane protein YphA (DoxX/SURF4 family)